MQREEKAQTPLTPKYIPLVEPLQQAISHVRKGRRTKPREILANIITGIWEEVLPPLNKTDPKLARRFEIESQLLRGYGRELKPEPPLKIAEMLDKEVPEIKQLQTELIFSTRKPSPDWKPR